MTEREYAEYLASRGLPFRWVEDRLQCMDLSQIPGAHREQYFDKQGMWSSPAVVESATTETADSASTEG